jgi:hypothetical protein
MPGNLWVDGSWSGKRFPSVLVDIPEDIPRHLGIRSPFQGRAVTRMTEQTEFEPQKTPAPVVVCRLPSLGRFGQAPHEQNTPRLRVTDQEQEGMIGTEHRNWLWATYCHGFHHHARGSGSFRT